MDSTKSVATRPPRRVWKWLGIPALLLLVLVLGFLGWAYVRGTYGEQTPVVPKSSAEGVVSQLLEVADGRRPVRVATVVDFPFDDVWAVVIDYEHFAEIFPYVKSAHAIEEAPDKSGRRRFHLTGTVSTLVGDWPLDAHVTHEEYEGDCVASWKESSERLPLNSGRWFLRSMGPDKTLVVYELELEARPYPVFLVRAALLSGLKPVVAAVDKRLRDRGAAKGG
jgi:hypothetical protein